MPAVDGDIAKTGSRYGINYTGMASKLDSNCRRFNCVCVCVCVLVRLSADIAPYCSAHYERLIMKRCMYAWYRDANNVSNFGGDPVTQLNLKKRLQKCNLSFCSPKYAQCWIS